MPNDDRRTDLTRRGALASGLAAAAAGFLPGAARAAPDLHHYAARTARAIGGQRDVSLRILLPRGSFANVSPVARMFTDLSGIPVELREINLEEVGLQISLDSVSGSMDYDLALPATFSLPDLVEVAGIRPLTGYARRHEPEGFRDGSLYGVGDDFDGEVYGFQTDGDAYMMFYLADRLSSETEQARYADRFGHALAVPDTWAELDRQIAWFHRPDEGMTGGLLFRSPGYLAWEWWARIHAGGVWPLSPDLAPQLCSDAGIAALEAMIRVTGYLAPEVRTAGLVDNWVRYAQGDIYANIGWGGSQKYFNTPDSPVRGRLIHGPTPGGVMDGEVISVPYFNWGWSYVVTSASPEPEIAYLFALFAASPDMSALAVRQADGFFDPFREEHYDDDGIKAAYSEPFLAVHRQSMTEAVPDLYLARQSDYFHALSEGLMRAIDGTIAPERALRLVEQRWELISLEVGRERQRRRWQALRRKYPDRLRASLRDLPVDE